MIDWLDQEIPEIEDRPIFVQREAATTIRTEGPDDNEVAAIMGKLSLTHGSLTLSTSRLRATVSA
jgi:hypothetical protein